MKKICSNCLHWKRAKPYAWGICKHPVPFWCHSSSPMIAPKEPRAEQCDGYTPIKSQPSGVKK